MRPVTVPATTHRFTVSDYHKMAEAGILSEDDRVELIEGEIIEMPPIGPPRVGCVNRLTELFIQGLPGRVIVQAQAPVRLSERSEPQPDLALLRRQDDFYATMHARPEDVCLIVEVADTSLAYDREVKVPLYARASIPEVWLVDLNGRRVTVYREPRPNGYANVTMVRGREHLFPQAFPDFTLTADEILG